MPLAPLCEELYQVTKDTCLSLNAILNNVIKMKNDMQKRLGKLSPQLDIVATVNAIQVPQVKLYSPQELLDLVLNCPILSCAMPMVSGLITFVQGFVDIFGPFDPYSAPSQVLDKVTPYVNLVNSTMRDSQAYVSQATAEALGKSPIGQIGRLKGVLDDYVQKTGIQVLMNTFDQTLQCLETNYAEAQDDPDFNSYKQLKAQIVFDVKGNVKVMEDAEQTAMNDYESKKTDMKSLTTRLY